MSEPNDNRSAKSGHGLHYLIAFTSFALVVLVLTSGKINHRQQSIEQQFHGIQQMQRGGGSAAAEARSPESVPQAISMRPLMWLLIVPLIAAWLILLWRRFRIFRGPSKSR